MPIDDGACLHLARAALPSIALTSTSGAGVDLSGFGAATVLFFYPRTGVPNQPPSLGFAGEEWDSIPGARGCTPQSCGFRDLYAEFRGLGIEVFGVSTNSPDHQREFRERTHIPFQILSDERLELTRRLKLPTFEFPVESGGPNTLIQRMAWYVEPDLAGVPRIVKVWYPVFPPDKNAADVLAWLRERKRIKCRSKTAQDQGFVEVELRKHWADCKIWSRGHVYNAGQLPALVAEVDGLPVGLLTYSLLEQTGECEVVTLSSREETRGVGTLLLDRVVEIARRQGCLRVFLTTGNENVHALGFYQRRGWRLAALHAGSLARARAAKPGIPVVAPNGIPIRDELELELPLR